MRISALGAPDYMIPELDPNFLDGHLGGDPIFQGGRGTLAGIHWTVWASLPVAAAAGGAVAAGEGRRGWAALGSAAGSLVALAAFAVYEMRT